MAGQCTLAGTENLQEDWWHVAEALRCKEVALLGDALEEPADITHLAPRTSTIA